jgi:trk system potassium uptake protein
LRLKERDLIQRILADDRVEAWRERCYWPNTIVALVALGTFLLLHGGVIPRGWEAPLAAFHAVALLALVVETVGVFVVARTLREGFRFAPMDTLALLVGVVIGVALLAVSPWVLGVLDERDTLSALSYLTQTGMLVFVGIRLLRVMSFFTNLVRSPLLVFMGSFAALIAVGTLLLLLPGAHAEGHVITFTDALFTATSASCVTGLIVLDTGTAFSRFGQTVIIVLVQFGGLGMMTFATFFSLAFGRALAVKDAAAAGEVMNMDFVGRVGRTVAWILGLTIGCEAIGVALMYGHWVEQGTDTLLPASEQLYYSVFHSISAFCNAGFCLYPDSLSYYVGHWPMVLTTSGLVILGGLGFLAVYEVMTFRFWAHPYARQFNFIRRRVRDQRLPRLSLQTKLILTATLILLVSGAALFWLLEMPHTLKDLSWDEKLAASLFQSMASRTAGFNSVDIGETHASSQFLTIMLMLVGGSPGSVAGGLKTTTFMVMILAVIATLRGRPTEAFKRRIPDSVIRKCLTMLALAITFICTATLLLLLTESAGVGAMDNGFERILFEVSSAFCTVGMSTGITGELTEPGRAIIIACMYFGRIGPLTLVLALGRRAERRFEYPEEPVMVG